MCDLQHTCVALFPTQTKFYYNMTIASQCVQSHCLQVHMVPGHALPVTVCVFMQLLLGRVVILLLLILSGDIETNPGPIGESSVFCNIVYAKASFKVVICSLVPRPSHPSVCHLQYTNAGRAHSPTKLCVCATITNTGRRMTEHFDILSSECHFTTVQKKCATPPHVHPMSKCIKHVISLPGLPRISTANNKC